MTTKRVRADKVQIGDKIPFYCEEGNLIDEVSEVQVRDSFVTIRFKTDQYGITPLTMVKKIDDPVEIIKRKA